MQSHTLRVYFFAAAVFLTSCTSAAPVSSDAVVNADGLIEVRSRTLDESQIRPGTDFSRYTGLVIDDPELAFAAADGDKNVFELDSDQKQKFAAALSAAFDAELASLDQLRLVTESAADVLELSVRVQDIAASVPGRSAGGPGYAGFALEAGGSVTLVLELKDSLSQQVLARGMDQQKVEGAAIRQKGGGMVTRWTDVDKLCADWAKAARKGIDTLTAER